MIRKMLDVRLGRRLARQSLERPFAESEAGAAVARRPVTLDEVFVGVRGVELHHLDRILGSIEAGDRASHESLAGPGRAVEDHPTLVLQEPLDPPEITHVEEEGVREVV
jgi:hypothetical protein